MQSPIFSVCLKELNYQPVAPPLTAVIMNADVTLCYGRVCLPRGRIWQRWKCMAGLQPLEWPVADMDIFPGGLGRNTLWSKWRVDMCQGSKWAAPFWVRWGQRWLPCDLETVIPTLLKYTYMLFFRRKYIFCRTKNEKKNKKTAVFDLPNLGLLRTVIADKLHNCRPRAPGEQTKWTQKKLLLCLVDSFISHIPCSDLSSY